MEMNARDFNQKIEIHGYKLEITEKEMRAQQYQYEARVMAEAMGALENSRTQWMVSIDKSKRNSNN